MKWLMLFLTFLIFLSNPKNIQSDSPDWLEPWYLGYNIKYFNNELPTKIYIDHELKDDSVMAVTNFIGEVIYIRFNRKYEPSGEQARGSLLHEMCHVYLKISNQIELDNHGPKWQSCMHKLADKRAFEDIW